MRGKRAAINLQTRSKNSELIPLGEGMFLVLMINLMFWLGGRSIPIDRAKCCHQRSSLRDDAMLWGHNPIFGTERTEIEFASHYCGCQ